jgi:hypothetical protein
MQKIVLTHNPGFHGYSSRHVIDFSAKTGIPESRILLAAIDDHDGNNIVGFAFDEILKRCTRDIELEVDRIRLDKLQSIHPDVGEAMRIAIAGWFHGVAIGRCNSIPHLNSSKPSTFIDMLCRYAEASPAPGVDSKKISGSIENISTDKGNRTQTALHPRITSPTNNKKSCPSARLAAVGYSQTPASDAIDAAPD